MKSFDFIVKELELFLEKFSKTKVRYQDDVLTNVHFIEVVPNEIYDFDEDYIKWEKDFFKRFILEYPCENICFISDNSTIDLDEVHFQKKGLDFVSSTTITQNVFIFNNEITPQVTSRSSIKINLDISEEKSFPIDEQAMFINSNNHNYQLAA